MTTGGETDTSRHPLDMEDDLPCIASHRPFKPIAQFLRFPECNGSALIRGAARDRPERGLRHEGRIGLSEGLLI